MKKETVKELLNTCDVYVDSAEILIKGLKRLLCVCGAVIGGLIELIVILIWRVCCGSG